MAAYHTTAIIFAETFESKHPGARTNLNGRHFKGTVALKIVTRLCNVLVDSKLLGKQGYQEVEHLDTKKCFFLVIKTRPFLALAFLEMKTVVLSWSDPWWQVLPFT